MTLLGLVAAKRRGAVCGDLRSAVALLRYLVAHNAALYFCVLFFFLNGGLAVVALHRLVQQGAI